MSVQDQIERLAFNVADSYSAVLEKNGQIPQDTNSDNLPNAIRSIETSDVSELINAPIGSIIAWSGSSETIPDGWHACDGEDGTLALQDKFILGGESDAPGEVLLTKYKYYWSSAPLALSDKWTSIAFGDGKFVAVSYTGNIIYSTDGITWSSAEVPEITMLTSVAYGNGTFVALAQNNTKSLYSTDGINWSSTTIYRTFKSWSSVTFGDGKFVAIANNSTVSVYSTDGINWSYSSMPSYVWTSVTYGAGKFLAVASYSDVSAYSTDGANWTISSPLPVSTNWSSVVYGDGKFIAVANDSNIAAYSTDGIIWASFFFLPISGNWLSIVYGDGKFITVAQQTNMSAYSTDGINWVASSLPVTANWYCVGYGNEKFVALPWNSGTLAYAQSLSPYNFSYYSLLYIQKISQSSSDYVTIDEVNELIQDALANSASSNIYSTEETIIGTWIDEKPLYRRVINATMPSTGNVETAIAHAYGIETLVHLYGFSIDSYGNYCPEPFPYPNTGDIDSFYFRHTDEAIICIVGGGRGHILKRPVTLVLEYTKAV